jgi:lipopolysaccharide transport system ATP-binding protein
MSSDVSISVNDICKYYQIYDKPIDRLKQSIYRGRKRFYKEFAALDNVSFEVKKGETVGIIGRNGSGKSTLLQLICGTLTPTSGSIETNGRVAALLELGSGFNPEFTGRENVYLNASILGLSIEEINDRYNDIITFADIGEFIEQPVKSYSSGMTIRLAFAVAINVDPQILIVDEALSVGDELFQRKCFSRIESIKNKGTTILFVSHSASLINQLCDNAILLESGKLLLRAKPKAALKYYHQLIFSKVEDGINISVDNETVDEGSAALEGQGDTEYYSDYIQGMKVAEPLKYQSDGGEIVSFEIQDVNANKVNIVSTGFSGLVKLTVRFDKSFNDVVFGFNLKSISGLEVAGLSYPLPNEPYIEVSPGDVLEVCWMVNILLAAGTYFFTFGVRSVGDEGFIDRIVDADILKVIEKENTNIIGLFDISHDGGSWINTV